MNKRSIRTIGDVCRFEGGSQPPKSIFSSELKEGYVRLIQIRDYKSNNFKTYIPKESTKKFCSKMDIMIGRYGPPIFQILRGIEGAYNVALMKAIAKENITNDYLYYFLTQKCLFEYINALSPRTGGQTGVDVPMLNEYPILLPEKPIQKQIAKVLSDLDTKIEINNKINQQLEAMAKLIYDYWFVQFDFPMPKAYAASIGRPELAGKPYKDSGGKIVYNAELKREIPEDWEDGTFDDVAKIIGGSTPSKADSTNFTTNDGTPWITPKDLSIHKGKKYISKGEINVTTKGIKCTSLKLLPPGTILLSSRAPIGYLAIAREAVTTNQGFKSFVSKKYFTPEFLYYQIKNKIPLIEKSSSGSTFKEVSGSILKSIKILMPPSNIMDSYQEMIKPMFEKQNLVEQENQKLAELRDWLLPMLMNGQVTVKAGNTKVEHELDMAAEERAGYRNNSDFVDSLFENFNFYKEIAAVQLIEEETTGRTHGKTGIQKTMSNLQQILKEERLEKLKFEEKPWGMFSNTIAENIETNPFIYKFKLENGKKVYRVKPEAKKVVQNWINLNENRSYITSINQILLIYQDTFINNDIYKIELLNTVYRCMSKFKSDDLSAIRRAMEDWPMIERKYKNKAEKFSERITAKMIDFIKKNQLI